MAAHRGTAMPRFIDSCVVGVNEWGSKPSRLVEPINRISETNMRAQVRPLVLCVAISCFSISWINHCCREVRRLLMSREGEGKKILGVEIMRTTTGIPTIVGVIKEENRFSFILILKG